MISEEEAKEYEAEAQLFNDLLNAICQGRTSAVACAVMVQHLIHRMGEEGGTRDTFQRFIMKHYDFIIEERENANVKG